MGRVTSLWSLRELGVGRAADPDDAFRIRTLNSVSLVGVLLTTALIGVNLAMGIYDVIPWLVALSALGLVVPLLHGLHLLRAAGWVVAAGLPLTLLSMVAAGFALQGTSMLVPVALLMPLVALRRLSPRVWTWLCGSYAALTWFSIFVGLHGPLIQALPDAQAPFIEANVGTITVIIGGGFLSLLRYRQSQVAKALRESLAGAQAAADARIDLLSKVSHELRTPAAATFALLEEIARAPDEEAREDALARARVEAARQVEMLGDLVDVVSLRGGELAIASRPFDFDAMLSSACTYPASLAAGKGLRFIREGELGARLGDEGRIAQVLRHLLANAVEHTAKGSVRVSVEALGVDRVRLRVVDSGRGLDPHEVRRLMAPFEQGSSGLTRVDRGLGVGLTLVEAAVSQMLGALDIDSSPGRGTTVSIELPMPAAPAPSGSIIRWSGQRALIVDDLQINRRILRRLLDRQGVECVEAEDGEAGLRVWREAQPDFVLMDMQMPVMDGIECTRRIRGEGGRTVIIAVTANATAEAQRACREAGMDGFLTKPLRLDELGRLLSRPPESM